MRMAVDRGFTPVVIIGAPRSGTNMLRDVITTHPRLVTWPCDEINYIWRHGNRSWPTDEIPAGRATPRVKDFIRDSFTSLSKRHWEADFLVEKTCANSLRVPFVDAVLPDARYLFLVRDGRDVLASAMERWTGDADLVYLLKKARYVPVADLPYYGSRFFINRVRRLMSRERQAPSWGPRFEGMDDVIADGGLPAVCAAQWSRCVDLAQAALEDIGPDRVLTLRYEDIAANPGGEMGRVATFLGIDPSAMKVGSVSTKSVGRWKQSVNERDLEIGMRYMQPTLSRLGYAPPSATGSV